MLKNFIFLCLFSASCLADNIKISSIDWCPQLCPDGKLPGYVMNTVKAVFVGGPYQIQARAFPWTRAISNVQGGTHHALLSPAKAEAPELIFPDQEVGVQRMCFFVKAGDTWRYTGLESLTGKKVGIAKDTSIEELNAYVASHPEQFKYLPYNSKYITRSLKKLEADRIDTFIFTYNSTVYELQQNGLRERVADAGCVSVAKIYMAFTPDPKQQVEVQAMIDYFNKRMLELKQNGGIAKIMQQYGLQDWQEFVK